ncbi:MAG: GNAT family N-acetyltransferase, partial [Vicinamibacteria bacterium]
VALEVAKALGAVKLVFVTTAEGLMVNGQVARQVAVDELSKSIVDGSVAANQLSKARHAVAACHAGIARVHVISGQVDEGLLDEVFSNEGVGTMVYANEYRQIRRARKSDVRSIQQLIQASVDSEELLPRTRAAIEKQIDDYYIYEVDKNPVACVALHQYPETKQGELACLYVKNHNENQGVGRRMVQFVEERAREQGIKSLLALSTQAFNFFQSKAGFVEGTPNDLPPGRREKYEQSKRHSKVLVKTLVPDAAVNARAS